MAVESEVDEKISKKDRRRTWRQADQMHDAPEMKVAGHPRHFKPAPGRRIRR
jgi:hypothetical protein